MSARAEALEAAIAGGPGTPPIGEAVGMGAAINFLVAGLHKVKKTLGNGASSTRGRREGGVRR